MKVNVLFFGGLRNQLSSKLYLWTKSGNIESSVETVPKLALNRFPMDGCNFMGANFLSSSLYVAISDFKEDGSSLLFVRYIKQLVMPGHQYPQDIDFHLSRFAQKPKPHNAQNLYNNLNGKFGFIKKDIS